MKMEITAGELSKALQLIVPLADGYGVPLMGAVLIGEDGLVGGSMDTKVTVQPGGERTGRAAIEMRALAALARRVEPDRLMAIDASDGAGLASVRFDAAHYRFSQYDASPYPEFPPVPDVMQAVGNSGLVEALRSIAFAMCTEETRYYLNGVYLCRDDSGDGAIAVATDGHCMAYAPVALQIAEGEDHVILPLPIVRYLIKRKQGPVTAGFDAARRVARMEWPGVHLDFRLIDGKYPDWRKIVPDLSGDDCGAIDIDRDAMLLVLRRLASVSIAQNPYRQVVLQPDPAEGRLQMLLQASSEYESGESLAAGFSGQIGRRAFNFRYLIEVLTRFPAGATVFMEAKGEGQMPRPVLFSSEMSSLRVIVMPQRIR